MLNFTEQTGSGAVILVWSFPTARKICRYLKYTVMLNIYSVPCDMYGTGMYSLLPYYTVPVLQTITRASHCTIECINELLLVVHVSFCYYHWYFCDNLLLILLSLLLKWTFVFHVLCCFIAQKRLLVVYDSIHHTGDFVASQWK